MSLIRQWFSEEELRLIAQASDKLAADKHDSVRAYTPRRHPDTLHPSAHTLVLGFLMDVNTPSTVHGRTKKPQMVPLAALRIIVRASRRGEDPGSSGSTVIRPRDAAPKRHLGIALPRTVRARATMEQARASSRQVLLTGRSAASSHKKASSYLDKHEIICARWVHKSEAGTLEADAVQVMVDCDIICN